MMQLLSVPTATVTIGDRAFPYERRWSGKQLLPSDGYLAFDTETDLVDLKRQVPHPVLASASAGERHNTLVHPDDLARFVLAHRTLHFVCHHSAFDFWVVEQHFRQRGEEAARLAWWEIAAGNRLHDSMLLDMLLRLARHDQYPDPRNLALVARDYADLEIDKTDPYRLRYGELLGQTWEDAEDGFFAYAVKDAIVTRLAYQAIRRQAHALVLQYPAGKEIRADARTEFGLLTEAVQVKKAIALAQITRHGMQLDRARLDDAEADLRQRLAVEVAAVTALCPDLYKRDADGRLLATGQARSPSKNQAVLLQQLESLAETLQAEGSLPHQLPRTAKKGQLSAATKFWQEYANGHPFLRHWVAAEELAKLLQFFNHLRASDIHPHYSTLVRSGRTSCSGPNVQQIPRDSAFREAFVPSPGHYLLTVDYSYIELRTLAAHALHRYGQSDLADVIQRGADPHVHTAAMMLGVSAAEFQTWKGNKRVEHGAALQDRYEAARQAAKAVNFGVPGGLGAGRLQEYARHTFGVQLSLEEARAKRGRLMTIYRELDAYLSEDTSVILARNLEAPLWAVRNELGDIHMVCIWKILCGNPKKADGTDYQRTFVSRIWASLAGLNRNASLAAAMQQRTPSEALAKSVCQAGVATLTGRLRGHVRYSQARNTPFQGLAADGAALVLFRLVREGYRVVAFVHDEILVELPDEGGFVAEASVRRVERIMNEEMARVLVGDIPVACEAALGERWCKKAKLICREGRVYPWRLPETEAPAETTALPSNETTGLPGNLVSPVDPANTPSVRDPETDAH
ncbi:MAG: hypothetical protein JNM56_27270 [Planctomycetia bacterium]|nr:hypothetical protein [Planctomycetia bacterium]